MKQKVLKGWGFDTKGMDKSVDPSDDFHQYASGTWLKTNKIPPTEARWGSFTKLRVETEHQLHALMNELAKKKFKKGETAQIVSDLFKSGIDQKGRNKAGLKPLLPYLEIIRGIKTRDELFKVIAKLHKLGVTAPWGYAVDQDSKQSTKYALHIYQSGLGLPDRDYYIQDTAEFLRVKKEYVPFIQKMLSLGGKNKKEAVLGAATILEIETRLAEASMTKVDSRDSEKTYNKKSWSELQNLFSALPVKKYFKDGGLPQVPYVIVMQPEFIKAASKLLMSAPLEDIKNYLEWHLLLDAAPHLSHQFVVTNFNFYGRILSGNKQMRPLWRRVLGAVNGMVGEAVGKMYVERHFKADAQKKMNMLVDDLFVAYEARMKNLDWMSAATKKKAIAKLHAMVRKIGHPTKWKTYKGLIVQPDDYFGNIIRAGEQGRIRELKKLKKQKVDRSEWFMSPQTVNAYCNFTMNEIVFPAAILQPPFFNPDADAGVNYGAIGSVIGHEMTHAFDDQGSKFDGLGNMKVWWTKEDKKRFENKAKRLVTQFDSYLVHGVHVNGKLTLGENIADLGGVVIAFDAYQKHLKKEGRKIIDGYTPEERFFLGFAQQERELSRPEAEKTAVLTDPHSPAQFRINGPLANVPAFYAAFNVDKKSKLYRKPGQRTEIW